MVLKILMTGICRFVGNSLAHALKASHQNLELVGLDNLIGPGSKVNRDELNKLGVNILHGDLRIASDLETLPAADVVIDAAANPRVLAGVDGKPNTQGAFIKLIFSYQDGLSYFLLA